MTAAGCESNGGRRASQLEHEDSRLAVIGAELLPHTDRPVVYTPKLTQTSKAWSAWLRASGAGG